MDLFYVYESYECIHVCGICMSGASRGQKRASDILDLELGMYVNHCEGPETQTRVLSKSSRSS